MKNSNLYMLKLMTISLVGVILLYVLVGNLTKQTIIIITPFLFCDLALFGKTIFQIKDSRKLVKVFSMIFNISFLFFWFSYLTYWCYRSIISEKYLFLLPSIPFFLIGIYILYKILPKKKKKTNIKHKKINWEKYKNIAIKYVPRTMTIIFIIIGSIMFYFGIKDIYQQNKNTAGYKSTTGDFINYTTKTDDSNKMLYQMTYKYTVDGKEYRITSNYQPSYLIKNSKIRIIKYDPKDPNIAVIIAEDSNFILIFSSIFFLLSSGIFYLFHLLLKGSLTKFKIDIFGLYIGFFILALTLSFISMQYINTRSIEVILSSFGLLIIIPIILIILGLFIVIKSIFFPPKKEEDKKLKKKRKKFKKNHQKKYK